MTAKDLLEYLRGLTDEKLALPMQIYIGGPLSGFLDISGTDADADFVYVTARLEEVNV